MKRKISKHIAVVGKGRAFTKELAEASAKLSNAIIFAFDNIEEELKKASEILSLEAQLEMVSSTDFVKTFHDRVSKICVSKIKPYSEIYSDLLEEAIIMIKMGEEPYSVLKHIEEREVIL